MLLALVPLPLQRHCSWKGRVHQPCSKRGASLMAPLSGLLASEVEAHNPAGRGNLNKVEDSLGEKGPTKKRKSAAPNFVLTTLISLGAGQCRWLGFSFWAEGPLGLAQTAGGVGREGFRAEGAGSRGSCQDPRVPRAARGPLPSLPRGSVDFAAERINSARTVGHVRLGLLVMDCTGQSARLARHIGVALTIVNL